MESDELSIALMCRRKQALKQLAISEGLAKSGFGGRPLSRMRKRDFVEFLVHQTRRPSGSEDEDFLRHFGMYLLLDPSDPSDPSDNRPRIRIRIPFFDAYSSDEEEEVKKNVREPLEEDEKLPDFSSSQAIEIAEHKLACVVCKENYKNTVFLNCRHSVTCIACSKKISTCPVCRSLVSESSKVRIF